MRVNPSAVMQPKPVPSPEDAEDRKYGKAVFIMKSLIYLEEIKNEYELNNEDLSDICDKLAYIARDNGEDDTILCTLSEILYEMQTFPLVRYSRRSSRPVSGFPNKKQGGATYE